MLPVITGEHEINYGSLEEIIVKILKKESKVQTDHWRNYKEDYFTYHDVGRYESWLHFTLEPISYAEQRKNIRSLELGYFQYDVPESESCKDSRYEEYKRFDKEIEINDVLEIRFKKGPEFLVAAGKTMGFDGRWYNDGEKYPWCSPTNLDWSEIEYIKNLTKNLVVLDDRQK